MKRPTSNSYWHGPERELVCVGSLEEFWEIPARRQRIWLVGSSKPVAGAVRSRLNADHEFVSARSQLYLMSEMRVLLLRHFGTRPFWWWVKYRA